MEVKAKLRFARMAPRKLRLVADLVRGKNVNDAMKALAFLNKNAAPVVKKLIKSAVANAEQKKTVDVDNLFVKHITVDQGPTMKRFMPRAQGRASEIRKKTSHINVTLAEK
ncbi:MAG: 50S ribosomal protein L22 [Oligoflexia bacterium]|nr:50S ribosomal protein L22 [Oligoflexia bacterium]